MKRILITGANSYIGTSVKNWLMTDPLKYSVDTINMKGESWKESDFSKFDVVFHVAGIAHVSSDPKMKDLYYRVNRDLAIDTARKAKDEGVKQFIFMSSIIVYGDSSSLKKIIDKETKPIPTNLYGNSKLQAEEGIKELQSAKFNVVILRSPMIYGKGSKGNYIRLAKIAKRFPFFPDIYNERSMLYIDNLCEFIKLMIDYEEKGIFFPQNKDYVRTSDMVKIIAEIHGNNIKLVKIFNPIIKLMSSKIGIINKVFGNLAYDKSMSTYKKHYCLLELKETILKTEKGEL